MSQPAQPRNDTSELAHHTKRSRGRLLVGPQSDATHAPRVIDISVDEHYFEDSVSAIDYMNQVGSKDPNARTLINIHDTRFVSRDDDK